MIKIAIVKKLPSGKYRLYSRKKDKSGHRKNLGTFPSLAAVKKHERAIQFFKSHNDDGMADDKETKTLKHLSDLATYLEEAGYIKASDKIYMAMECLDPSLAECDYIMDGISDYERNVGGKEPGAYYSGSAGDSPSLLSADAPTLIGRIDMSNILKKLAQVAEQLDSKGLYKEADRIDSIIKIAISQSNLIRALKNDDQKSTMHALTEFISSLPSHTSPERELGMTRQEFQEFADSIKSGDLDKARELYGVGKDVKMDPSMYNPITGQPWPSTNITKELQFVRDTLNSIFETKEISLETVPDSGIACVSWLTSVHHFREAGDMIDKFKNHGYTYDEYENRQQGTRDEFLAKKINDNTEIEIKLHSEPSDYAEDWSWVYVTIHSSDVEAITLLLKNIFGV